MDIPWRWPDAATGRDLMELFAGGGLRVPLPDEAPFAWTVIQPDGDVTNIVDSEGLQAALAAGLDAEAALAAHAAAIGRRLGGLARAGRWLDGVPWWLAGAVSLVPSAAWLGLAPRPGWLAAAATLLAVPAALRLLPRLAWRIALRLAARPAAPLPRDP